MFVAQILREQWHGLGLACDIALMTGDKDMASAVWRNLLGARGAHGIAYPEAPSTPSTPEDPTSEQKLDPATGGVTDFEGTPQPLLRSSTLPTSSRHSKVRRSTNTFSTQS